MNERLHPVRSSTLLIISMLGPLPTQQRTEFGLTRQPAMLSAMVDYLIIQMAHTLKEAVVSLKV